MIVNPKTGQILSKLATRYTQAEIERALFALVLADGRPSVAVQRLEAAGQSVPLRTLQEWRNVHSDIYERLQAEREQRVSLQFAEAFENLVPGLVEVQHQQVQKALAGEGSANTAMLAAKNAALTAAVNVDKAALLRGKPSSIVEHRDMAQLLKTLERKFGHVVQVNPDLIEADVDEASGSPAPSLSSSSVGKASGSDGEA